ncbi:MAG: YbhB/YbcL family Raf kinase inhibitor-like protein [Candidatus Parcubacteria bacterium]|nr:YbhB/YbcL family Raf kinase inhibitor-like protein [Candidatus Parcubacteria bacterium]
MKFTSSTFTNNSNLPSQFTCDGQKINPPLEISNVPAAAKSLALIVDDPDAPSGTFVHWLVWNINPQTKSIAANTIPAGAKQGTTSAGKTGYVPPCPPSGSHHYVFKLYALDTLLDLTPNAGKDNLEQAMQGHTLDYSELIGLYKRNK